VASTGAAPGQDIDRITDRDVYFANTSSLNSARGYLVLGILTLVGGTVIAAVLGAALGRPGTWGQLSPVIDTLLAGEFAVLGSIVAFYMTRQD
jgi:hypothetical protein